MERGRERKREGGREREEKRKEGVFVHPYISFYHLHLLPTHQLKIDIEVAEIDDNVSQ